MLKPLGYVQLTSFAAGATLTVPAGARFARLRAEAQDVRFRDDGTAPTATVGDLLRATDTAGLMYDGNLSALKFAPASAGAILNVSFYGSY